METEQDLTQKELSRFKKIKWRRVNGLYFSYFEDKIEAFRYLQKIARRYAYSDAYTNKIKELVAEAQEDGIMLYPTQLGRWLREVFELEIVYKKETKGTTTTTLSYDTEVHDILNEVSAKVGRFSKSEFVNNLLRHHCGLDIEPLIVYLGDVDENPVSTMFFETEGGYTSGIHGVATNNRTKVY